MQNLWDTEKAGLHGKFINIIKAYIRKQEKIKTRAKYLNQKNWKGDLKINKLSFHFKNLERATKCKVKRSKEIIIIRAEINEMENMKLIEENQWNQKLVLWKKISKIHKPLARLTKEKKRKDTNY